MAGVRFTAPAHDQLARLDKPVAQQLLRKLHWLAENFEETVHLPLKGNLKGIYKLRVGDYRLLYTIEEGKDQIVVHFAAHRREVYKGR
jgi:mRNA interferase RelE/StbE